MQASDKERLSFARVTAMACALLVLLGLSVTSWRHGLGSWQIAQAEHSASVVAADQAVKLSPADADAHLIRAAILEANNDLSSAIGEYQAATALRPRDYVLWLALARALELSGERERAIATARMSVATAPAYAETRWQLGNLLLRGGRTEEAFNELRLAATSNPLLQQAVMDLVWQLSKGDAQLVKDMIRPADAATYTALGEYFKRRGQIEDATAMFEAAGDDSRAAAARNQFVSELITAKKFREAQTVWQIGRGSSAASDTGVIVNGGFEQETNLDEPGFNWRRENPASSISQSLDEANPSQGRASLRIDFNGDSDPNAAIISLLVLVAPATHYSLQLAVRAEAIVSGGPPVVTISDAGDARVLGQMDLSAGPATWRDQEIEFVTAASTSAIRIAVYRKRCSSETCPIFGRLWLDDISLHSQKVNR
jgi:hypothetical protein